MSAAKKVFWTLYFADYGASALSGDPEQVARFYAPSFLTAGPTGSMVHRNDDTFRDWLGQVFAANQATGMTAMEVLAVDEAPISDTHTLITVEWGARFAKTGDEVIAFRIAYLVELLGEKPAILAYVSHEDQAALMSAKGLI
jgi:hypothetical protein